MRESQCVCCAIAEDLDARGALFGAGPLWTCNARVGHERPALVIQTRAHREHLSDLSPDERCQLGDVLATASAALAESGPVERVYTLLFNEGRPGHVHYHVVPRFVGEQEIGPGLPDRVPDGVSLDAVAAAAIVEARLGHSRIEPSAIVRTVRRAADLWNRRVSPYRWSRPVRQLDAGETYVLSWLAVWIVALAGASLLPSGSAMVVLAGALAIVRGLDMALYEVGILLKMEQSPLRSVPRGLVLRVLTLVEIWLAGTTALLAHDGAPQGLSAALHSFRAVLLQPEFSQPGTLPDIVVSASLCISLLVLTGGISMLIGKVAETFHEG